MTDKVQKIKEWIQTRKLCTMDEHMKFYCREAESDYNLLCSIEKVLDSLQEDPVTPVWHDASEVPQLNKELIVVGEFDNALVLSSNSESFKNRKVTKWAYFDDLLKLSNVERIGKNWKEDHVDKCKGCNNVKGCITCVDGDQWAHYEEPAREELDEEIKRYLHEVYDRDDTVGDIARHFAKWQKEQMMKNTADAMIGLPYENKDGGYTHLIDVSRPLPVGNNKIAIIFKQA